MTETFPRVLVLDANQRSALAVTRSLGRRGITVLTSDATPGALAARSRYNHQYLASPSPETEPDAFIDWLMATIREHDIGYLQPVTEISSQLILRHHSRLPERCILPFAALDTVMGLADKGDLVRLALEAHVACPETRFCDNAAGLQPDTVKQYPVVLKPRLSRIFLNDGWLNTAVAIAHTPEQLSMLLETRAEFRDYPFLVQEFIPGTGAGIFALYDHGQPVAFFAHRRLREKPPQGGVSVLSESAPPIPAALDAARKLLDHANWHGVAMVEFRVSPDGQPFLMEVNTRFWGSLQLAIDAGVDFPWLLYQLSLGKTVSVPEPYRLGQRLRWWLGDVDSLYLFLRDSRYQVSEKLSRVLAFCTPHPGKTRHETFRWSDPGPAWYELKAWLKALRSG